MKAILTKLEKERLLEQFEKSWKTHAQFAEENGLNVKTLSKWIYEWHHQIKTTNEVKFVEIKTTAISSVNDIRIKKSGMEISIPAYLEQYQLKNILTVLASIYFWATNQKNKDMLCRSGFVWGRLAPYNRLWVCEECAGGCCQ